MPIIVKSNGEETTTYTGRVVEVTETREQRNLSDTLDYSDWQTVRVVHALVWLGPEGKPEDQFTWIDCSNLFAWRGEPVKTAVVDGAPNNFMSALNPEAPLMWTNLTIYKQFKIDEAREAEEARARLFAQVEAERQAFADKKSAAALKRQATDEAKCAAAEALLEGVAKGKTYTTKEGFTGNLFWKGAKKYRGTWSARVGLKDPNGQVVWTSVDQLV
jgi:hypothetical protein